MFLNCLNNIIYLSDLLCVYLILYMKWYMQDIFPHCLHLSLDEYDIKHVLAS